MKCEHRRIKKNYYHGRKSQATKYCRDCGAVVSNKEIRFIKKKQIDARRRNRYG